MKKHQYKFRSLLGNYMQGFIQHKRALGYKYITEEGVLQLLDRYLAEANVQTIEQITPELIDAFLSSRNRQRPRSYNHLLGHIKYVLEWLSARGYIKNIPLTTKPRRVTSQRLPFIFNNTHAKELLVIAMKLPDNSMAAKRGMTYSAIFSLLYNLGLRIGEVCRLCIKDVDLKQNLLIIHNSKFNKSRYVPFGPGIAERLEIYLCHRQQQPFFPDSPFFTFSRHRFINPGTISQTFHQLVPSLKLNIPPGIASPRLHDLRHSFAVNTLLKWYQSGSHAQDMLIHLSTFLGHVDPSSTAVYLQITHDLLQTANHRFEQYSKTIIKGDCI